MSSILTRFCGILAFLLTIVAGDAATGFLKIVATQPGVDEPVAVRAIVQFSDGTFLPGEWGDSNWPAVSIRGKAVPPGGVIELPLGEYRITLGKGPDYFPETVRVLIGEPDATNTLNIALEPALDLYGRGWRAGDAHVHFFHGDNQISRSPEEAYAICGAGGLNWVSLAGEHYGAGLLRREEALWVWKQQERPDCQLWLGSEAPKSAWGHFAAIGEDPWSVSEALPYSEGIREIHAQGGISFPVHPERQFPGRSFNGAYSFYPLNNHSKVLPFAALAGHLLDGWSAISDQPTGPDFLNTYRKLLSLGYKIPLLADSDFCMDRVNNGLKAPGFWVNYVHLRGHALSRAAVAEAVRRGHVMATTGPLVLFSIDGQLPGVSFPADGVTQRRLRIEASYAFNPWTLSYSNFAGTAACVIESVELLRNGEVVRKWSPNEPHFLAEETLPAESERCNYMVRVIGNEGVWMAGYASPIYFERFAAPRQPPAFKMVVNGRLYDAKTGHSVTGTVSGMRFGAREWTVPTDQKGLFRVRVPIDATLVARDGQGRELARDWMSHEPAYAFGHYLPEWYQDKSVSIDHFAALMRNVTWEFPMGRQSPVSYVKSDLDADGVFSDLQVVAAPPRHPGKLNTEIVMLLVDKTQVQHGDTLNYAVIFRAPEESPPVETLMVQFSGWDPNYPRMYTRYAKVIAEDRSWDGLITLGDGFFLMQGSVEVPLWVRNMNRVAGAVRLRVAVRNGANVLEDAHLTLPLGATLRQLLVSTTWDGLQATWGGKGVGPCNFSREIGWEVRYPDYRETTVQLQINGNTLTIQPKVDTAAVPDADDAIFEDHHYYDAQCEPEFRNIPFRADIRVQPPEPAFYCLPVTNPSDVTPPSVVTIEPHDFQKVKSPVTFYFHADDAGLSGIAVTTLFVNRREYFPMSSAPPFVIDLEPGEYTWRVKGIDRVGNRAFSEVKRFTVVEDEVNQPLRNSYSSGEPSQNAASLIISNATVEWLGHDHATQGNWKGTFGSRGLLLPGGAQRIANGIVVSPSGQSQWTWTESADTDSRVLHNFGTNTRVASCWYQKDSFEIELNFTDALQHTVSVYCLDWDRAGRVQRVDVLDANSRRVLHSQQLQQFENGVYLSYKISGHVLLRFTRLQSHNAVLSGLFFD